MSAKSRVALCQNTDRVANIRQTLGLVIDDIDWSSRRHVVIKPNLVMANYPYAITHRDTLMTVLEMVRTRYNGPLTIAEGCAVYPTIEAFEAQGYRDLANFYNCQLIDLNADQPVSVTVYDQATRPLHLRLAQTIVASDCRISLSLPKTHDTILVTLSIKNMIMASLVNRRLIQSRQRPLWYDRLGQIIRGHGNGWGSDKRAMHQSYAVINLNLALLAPLTCPHLSILDGFVAMEGEGPVYGDPVSWGLAVAGTDPLAVDVFTARLMGFALNEVGYLHYCAQLGLGNVSPQQIELLGNVSPEAVSRPFKPHPAHEQQRRWNHPEASQLLQRLAVSGTL